MNRLINENKTPGIGPFVKVYLFAHHVHGVALVYQYGNSLYLKLLIVRFRSVETNQEGHPTAATFNPDAQGIAGWNVLVLHDLANFQRG